MAWRKVCLHARGEQFHHFVVDVALHKHALRAHTGLARVPELAKHELGHSMVQVSVIENDKGPIAAQFKCKLFETRCALRGKFFAHGSRPRKGDLLDFGVGTKG